jgi:hypothetical protein
MKQTSAILLLVLALALAGCGEPAAVAALASCPGPADAYGGAMAPIVERWDAAVGQADQATTAQRPGRVADLRAIRGEAASVMPAPCVSSAHGHLLGSMDATVAAFDGVVAGKPQADISASLDQAELELARFDAALRLAMGP